VVPVVAPVVVSVLRSEKYSLPLPLWVFALFDIGFVNITALEPLGQCLSPWRTRWFGHRSAKSFMFRVHCLLNPLLRFGVEFRVFLLQPLAKIFHFPPGVSTTRYYQFLSISNVFSFLTLGKKTSSSGNMYGKLYSGASSEC